MLFLNELEEILELLGADQLMQVHDPLQLSNSPFHALFPNPNRHHPPSHAGPYSQPFINFAICLPPVLQIREQLFRLIAKCLGSNHFQVAALSYPFPVSCLFPSIYGDYPSPCLLSPLKTLTPPPL